MRIIFTALTLMLFATTLHAQNLWRDPGYIGIGTKSPVAPLHIVEGLQQIALGTGTSISGYTLSIGVNDDGVNIGNNSANRGFNFRNYNGMLFSISKSGIIRSGATVAFFGPGAFTDSADNTSKRGLYVDNGASSSWILLTLQNAAGVHMRVNGNGYVGIGTINPKYKLSVEGTIGGRSVKVTQETWADFVFHADYKLPALSEVAGFIEKNAHLPGIPTERDVKENGIDLGEMNKLLLQKVEEQMLYIIQLNKQVQELSEKVKRLEK